MRVFLLLEGVEVMVLVSHTESIGVVRVIIPAGLGTGDGFQLRLVSYPGSPFLSRSLLLSLTLALSRSLSRSRAFSHALTLAHPLSLSLFLSQPSNTKRQAGQSARTVSSLESRTTAKTGPRSAGLRRSR